MFETANTNHNSTGKEHSQNFSAIVSIVIKLGTQSLDFSQYSDKEVFLILGILSNLLYTHKTCQMQGINHIDVKLKASHLTFRFNRLWSPLETKSFEVTVYCTVFYIDQIFFFFETFSSPLANVLILYPWKQNTFGLSLFYWCSEGVWNGKIGQEWVIFFMTEILTV